MASDDPLNGLREYGIALLRGVFPQDCLQRLREAAERCFERVAAREEIPESWKFNRFSHSVLLSSLLDCGCQPPELLKPLSAQGLDRLFADAIGGKGECRMEQAWVRRKFSPEQIPDAEYRPHTWHQDGALNVQFPLEAGPVIPITRLVTCWIPLTACGVDSPGLEFVRQRLDGLLHFTELDDSALRRRFSAESFWAPAFEAGDGVVFLNGTLHRTHVRPEMRRERLSVEYRIFPR